MVDRKETETWRNSSPGVVFVWKYDRFGQMKDEVVNSGGKFQISSEERIMNMENAVNAEVDNFRNGRLTPVRLLDSTEDAAEIASNPNLIGEDDMRGLMKVHWRTFEQKVGEISSLGTLNRLVQIANEGDATVRQMDVLKARIAELSPQVTEVTSEAIGIQTGVTSLSGRPI